MAWLWPRYQDDCYILRVRVPGMFPTNLLPDIIALVVKSILNFAHVVKYDVTHVQIIIFLREWNARLPVSTVVFLPHKSGNDKRRSRPDYRIVKIVLAALPILLLLALVIVLVILLTRGNSDDPKTNGLYAGCSFSDEAKRVGLDSFLDELLRKYFELIPENFGSKTGGDPGGYSETLSALRSSPERHQELHDEVRRLHDRLEEIIGKANGSRMKLRENKAMYVMQQLLKHSFDWGPYQRDYYVGDWMFEPNLYCWQPICNVLANLGRVVVYFKPDDLKGLDQIEELFKKHNETISRYIENLRLGVATGMVRSEESCKAGIHAIKINYYEIAVHNETGEAIALFPKSR
ncbi:hypothetical protein OS493_030846 [Desmophyllum pertusum]|uniref:Uncharacterized protein n=1 Tax=Desmophyllum pertusum TaxID=174260 RepID=A0A9W9YJW9_9CNID|nr:hypothetical protein OS493_030846 [Desmophyllum pertusum]